MDAVCGAARERSKRGGTFSFFPFSGATSAGGREGGGSRLLADRLRWGRAGKTGVGF